jgi:hypothetical protein
MNKNTLKVLLAVVLLAVAGVLIVMTVGKGSGGTGDGALLPDTKLPE